MSAVIGVSPYPPMTYECVTRKPMCRNPGLTQEIVAEIGRMLSIAFDYRIPEQDVNFSIPYYKIISLVEKGELDMGAELYSLNWDRAARVRYSTPMFQSESWYFSKQRSLDISMKLLVLRPFSFVVWLTFFLLILSTAVVLYLSEKLPRKTPHYWKSPLNIAFISIMRIVSAQNLIYLGVHKSFRLLIIAWLLTYVIVHNMYSGELVGQLSQLKEPLLIRSIEDLTTKLYSKQVRLITTLGPKSGWFENVHISTLPSMKKLRKALRANPPIFVSKREQLVEMVLRKENLVGLAGSYEIRWTLSDPCGLNIFQASEGSDSALKVFIFPKNNSVLRERVNRLIPSLWNHYKYLEKNKYLRPKQQCDSNQHSVFHWKKLRFLELADAFYLWGIGLSAAIAGFLVEKARAHSRRGQYKFSHGLSSVIYT